MRTASAWSAIRCALLVICCCCKASSPSDVGPDLARISKQLSAAELDRAKAFRLSDDPATPAFVKEYEVREPSKGWFKRVNSL